MFRGGKRGLRGAGPPRRRGRHSGVVAPSSKTVAALLDEWLAHIEQVPVGDVPRGGWDGVTDPVAAAVLTEDEVIDAVRDYLVGRSWRIVSRATAVQRGDDLVAERNGERLVIEAKGAGSSKIGTARFGKTFNKGQVFDHVGKAVLKAMRVVSAGDHRAGVALPGDAAHGAEVARIRVALDKLGVAVFWVDEKRAVTVESSWQP